MPLAIVAFLRIIRNLKPQRLGSTRVPEKPIANAPGLRVSMISVIPLVLLAGGLAVESGEALSPPPPLPEEQLVEFYQAMGGENWFNNDGWLDPDTPVCEWYGITCRSNPNFGFTEIAEIALPDNNLTGRIGNDNAFENDFGELVFEIPTVAIDLSGNRIEGPLDRIPFWLGRVDLSRNLLSGPLPGARDGVIVGTPPPGPVFRAGSAEPGGQRFRRRGSGGLGTLRDPASWIFPATSSTPGWPTRSRRSAICPPRGSMSPTMHSPAGTARNHRPAAARGRRPEPVLECAGRR